MIRRLRLARLRPRTLRAKLTWGLVVLLASSCAAVGLTAVLALRGYLTGQLDQQLSSSGCHFPASIQQTGTGQPDHSTANVPYPSGGHGDSRGQSAGTFGARLMGGVVTDTAIVRAGGSVSVALDTADKASLAAVPVDGRAHSVALASLGDYRVYACASPDGDVLLTGLPLASVQDTVSRLAVVAAAVFAAALVITGVAGAFWVRRSLRPLRRVMATAAAVTTLRLDSGEVTLPRQTGSQDPYSEAGQVAAALDRMLGHVQDALAKRHIGEERLRSFAADASHELRTPVASIRGHAELALRHPGPVPEKVERALRRVAAESARMSAMVDDLLLLARLDAGRPLQQEPVDLTRLVLDGAEDARAAGADHVWVLELPETPITLTGDGDRLTQAIGNLLANARQHTPPGTRVTISLQRQGAEACALTVADDGPGIPEELQHTLFERFTRADRRHPGAVHGGAGAGLGLSITAAIVAAHDGTVTVASAPGSTVFTLLLPTAARAGLSPG